MSVVKRYKAVGESVVKTDDKGPLVLWEDYARLKAELTDLKSEADRFKAEVERLRKAGDAMAKELPMIADTHLSDEVWVRMQSDWELAKEGKPSV